MFKYMYVSDRGEEFEVGHMETSHLLNVIAHHKRQLETLEWIKESYEFQGTLKKQIKRLEDTLELLVEELVTR
jgi:hypothetical protein